MVWIQKKPVSRDQLQSYTCSSYSLIKPVYQQTPEQFFSWILMQFL